jgi:hypothetical protein
MQTTLEPLSSREKKELASYVTWTVQAMRIGLYLGAVGFVGACLRSLHRAFGQDSVVFANEAWWIIPTVLFAVWLYRAGGRWTGGPKGRADIRTDLANGQIAVHRITVLDAIMVEELEDEGPSFFVLSTDREVIFFHGQEFDTYRRRGFPWREFEIRELPTSKLLFRLRKRGEKFQPSFVRKPLSFEEMKYFSGNFHGRYRMVAADFDSLKINPASRSDENSIS